MWFFVVFIIKQNIMKLLKIITKFFSKLFESREMTHVYHLQITGEGSYAGHKALDEYYNEVLDLIDDLIETYQGQYEIQVVPNIVHIGWGRGVGYTSGEEQFDESITNISATNIRKGMGIE